MNPLYSCFIINWLAYIIHKPSTFYKPLHLNSIFIKTNITIFRKWTYLNSSVTGNHDRQNKAFRRAPKNKDVFQRQLTPSFSTVISNASARALLLCVSSSSLRKANFLLFPNTAVVAADGEGGGDEGDVENLRRERRITHRKIDCINIISLR